MAESTTGRSGRGLMSRLIALDRYLSPPALVVARGLSALGSLKRSSNRTLIVRPGGLGDLIVATAALADLGLDPAAFDWVVERRSAVWAAHLGLSFWCYDEAGVLPLVRLAGSRTLCINLEQRYGLAAAFARAAVARRGVLAGFASNRGASAYDRTTSYDPLDQHELDATQALFADAIGVPRQPLRARFRAEPAGDHVVVAVAGTGSPARRWSGSDWVGMIRRYAGADRKILVTSPSDRRTR